MFNTDVMGEGEWLYFDLDVVIVDNIDCFFEHEKFGILRDFIRPDNGILPGKEYNSSIMRFNSKEYSSIYEYYISNKKVFHDFQEQVHFFGDQNVISSYFNAYPDFLLVAYQLSSGGFLPRWCTWLQSAFSAHGNLPAFGAEFSQNSV